MSEVVGILARTQHASLTALSDCMEDSTFEGLTAAAREARRRGLIPAALARTCERLDVAAHYARHTATAKGAAFIQVLTTALPSPTVLPACHRPTAEDPENGLDLYTGEKEVEEKIDPVATQCHNGGMTGIGTLILDYAFHFKAGQEYGSYWWRHRHLHCGTHWQRSYL